MIFKILLVCPVCLLNADTNRHNSPGDPSAHATIQSGKGIICLQTLMPSVNSYCFLFRDVYVETRLESALISLPPLGGLNAICNIASPVLRNRKSLNRESLFIKSIFGANCLNVPCNTPKAEPSLGILC